MSNTTLLTTFARQVSPCGLLPDAATDCSLSVHLPPVPPKAIAEGGPNNYGTRADLDGCQISPLSISRVCLSSYIEYEECDHLA